MCRVKNLNNKTMFVNGDVLYTELLNVERLNTVLPFLKNHDTVQDK